MFRLPRTITTTDPIVKTYDLDMGKVIFYKSFLIIEVAEGICFDYEKAKELSFYTNLHFGDRPFGYISHRVNSYSIEPTDYTRIKEVFPQLKLLIAVIYNKFQETSVKIENMFYQDGILAFENLEIAKTWVTKQLS